MCQCEIDVCQADLIRRRYRTHEDDDCSTDGLGASKSKDWRGHYELSKHLAEMLTRLLSRVSAFNTKSLIDHSTDDHAFCKGKKKESRYEEDTELSQRG